MKKLFSVSLILFSLIAQAQTLKTTIDNSIIGQGNKGITALKVRNTLHTIVDSVRLSQSPVNIVQSSSYRFVTDAEKLSWNGKLSITGGTMTGNLLLNNVVKVGGSSTFENTWLGQDVLTSITAGSANVAMGKNSLKAITFGSWNTGLGYKSIEIGTTATKNTGVGAYSLQNLTNGQYNTAVGFEAGKDLTTGYFNTYLGAFRGTGYETSNRRVFISDGVGNVRISVTSDGYVGIGTKDATSPLQIVDLPVFGSNSSAISAGLTAGAVYRSSTGFLMVVY